MQRRKLEELSLMDDFLFNAMLTHPETGEKFTNKILKLLFNREFKNLRVSVQKVYAGMNTDLRGARLDAQGEAAGREDGLRAGRLAEIKNTEREKKRADMAQSRIKELEAELKKYRKKTTV